MKAKAVDVGQGWSWIVCGFQLFMRSPGMWILIGLVLFLITLVLAFIPILGTLLVALLWPALAGGTVVAARAADTQQPVSVAQLFQPFRDSTTINRLMALGGIAAGATLATFIVIFAMAGASAMGMMGGGGLEAIYGVGAGVLLMILIALSIQLLVTMALLYAVPLVTLRGAAVGEAVASSFDACVRNVLPLFVFGLVYIAVAIVATIPFGLGWLVLLPASATMLYCSYKDLYESA